MPKPDFDSMTIEELRAYARAHAPAEDLGPEYDEDGEPRCYSAKGHEWAYTGTQYGGDDPSYFGEGRCYCVHCGADGDG
jgi:hypothetical protein